MPVIVNKKVLRLWMMLLSLLLARTVCADGCFRWGHSASHLLLFHSCCPFPCLKWKTEAFIRPSIVEGLNSSCHLPCTAKVPKYLLMFLKSQQQFLLVFLWFSSSNFITQVIPQRRFFTECHDQSSEVLLLWKAWSLKFLLLP